MTEPQRPDVTFIPPRAHTVPLPVRLDTAAIVMAPVARALTEFAARLRADLKPATEGLAFLGQLLRRHGPVTITRAEQRAARAVTRAERRGRRAERRRLRRALTEARRQQAYLGRRRRVRVRTANRLRYRPQRPPRASVPA